MKTMKTSQKKKNPTSPTITNIKIQMTILINLNQQKTNPQNTSKQNWPKNIIITQHTTMSSSPYHTTRQQNQSPQKRNTKKIQITTHSPTYRTYIIKKNPKNTKKKHHLSTNKNNKSNLKTMINKKIMITRRRLQTNIFQPNKKIK